MNVLCMNEGFDERHGTKTRGASSIKCRGRFSKHDMLLAGTTNAFVRVQTPTQLESERCHDFHDVRSTSSGTPVRSLSNHGAANADSRFLDLPYSI